MSFNAKRSTFQVLGCIIKKPDFVDEINYMIKDERSKKQILEDLFPEVFHRLIFSVVNNLYCEQNVRTIDYIAVDNFLSQYPTQYEVYKNNNGNEYVVEAISNCNLENFEYNLERLKKFALLRAYERIGVDTTEIYNENIVSPKKKEEMQEQFENMKLQDIVNEIEKKAIRIKDAFLSGVDNSSIHASEGVRELKERLKKTPEVGNSLCSGITNTIARGARLKKLYLRSGKSGGGKSRQSIGDIVTLGVDEIWSSEKKEWVFNGCAEPSLFISTELEETEVQTPILAFIADIDEEKIKYGNYTPEEENRIDKAIEILERGKIFIDFCPDFDADTIERLIQKHILENEIKYCVFDYVHLSSQMIMSMSGSGVKMREDLIILLFMTKLKNLCNKYNVFILTGSQINGDWKNVKNADSTVLRGM